MMTSLFGNSIFPSINSMFVLEKFLKPFVSVIRTKIRSILILFSEIFSIILRKPNKSYSIMQSLRLYFILIVVWQKFVRPVWVCKRIEYYLMQNLRNISTYFCLAMNAWRMANSNWKWNLLPLEYIFHVRRSGST